MYANLETYTLPWAPIPSRCFSVELLINPSFFFNLCDGVPYHKYMLCGSNRNDVLGMFDCYKTNVIDDSYCYYGDVLNYCSTAIQCLMLLHYFYTEGLKLQSYMFAQT